MRSDVKLRKSKRGSVLDVLFIVVILFVLAVVFFLSTNLFYAVEDNIQQSSNFGEANGTAKLFLSNFRSRWSTILDNSFVFIVVGLAVAVGISGFLLRDHPAFFFVGLILLLFFVLLAALFSNIYDGVSTAPAFVSYKSEFSKMDYIMSNMPLYLGMIGLLILIVIYAKTV